MDIKIKRLPEKTVATIDRIVAEKNKNSPKKMTRQDFLQAIVEEIPEKYLTQKQETETSILIKKQNELLQENLITLNVLAQYFISGDVDNAQRGLKLLERLSQNESRKKQESK